jgi:hypothetical protein
MKKVLMIFLLVTALLIQAQGQTENQAIGDMTFTGSDQGLVFQSNGVVYLYQFSKRRNLRLGEARSFAVAKQKNAVILFKDRVLRLIDLARQKQIGQWSLNENPDGRIFVSKDAKIVIFNSEISKKVYLVNLISSLNFTQTQLDLAKDSSLFSQSGRFFAVINEQKISIYETKDERLISDRIGTTGWMGNIEDLHNYYAVWHLQFSPDEKTVTILWGASIPKYWSSWLEQWTLEGQKIGEYPNSMVETTGGYTKNGDLFAAKGPQLIRVWNTKNFKLLTAIWEKKLGLLGFQRELQISSNGQHFAVRDDACKIHIFSTNPTKLISQITPPRL